MNRGFAQELKDWRGRRRMSQLQLALAAEVSARHVAFLETGRARPSRGMVLKLGEALDMPLAARNLMLDAAGFSGQFSAKPLDSDAMAPVRAAIRHMIDGHAPFPALVFDRHWVVIDANRPAEALLSLLGLERGDSLLQVLTKPGRGAELVENWAELAGHLVGRLRLESAHVGGDPVLELASVRLAEDPALDGYQPRSEAPPVLPIRLRMGGGVYALFSTITQFGTASDIALSDIKIEMFFPADADAESLFRGAAATVAP
ncbi:helix-turn-helix transcriptional regulator [Peteryoungia ipomoeae]|uniref:Helix-turn-helix domain-containing protein n=1 Tax=Peteryoungia ipomoeae TaxID=1210932 RepID=A0A4S8P4T3_9HYPH|nr:helix-turn-helix transcriptional regulator [Peteryoungia ipomoeae]THV25107.1 helix-turn-helix domain-containing protein [Peteryoungia ipomoeae]